MTEPADDPVTDELPDFDRRWDYADPAGSEESFRTLLDEHAHAPLGWRPKTHFTAMLLAATILGCSSPQQAQTPSSVETSQEPAREVAADREISCVPMDWDEPKCVSERLIDGDTAERKQVLGKLGAFDDKTMRMLAPALSEVYLEGGPLQKDVMRVLLELRDPWASDAYLHELQTDDTGHANEARESVG